MISKQLRLLAATLFAVLLFAPAAHAQLGVYGVVTLDHLTGLQNAPVDYPGVAYNNSVDPIGFTGGVEYGLKTYGPVRIGADVRGVTANSTRGAQANSAGAGTHIYSVLGGVKGTFRTRYSFVRPYVEGAIGVGRSNYGVLTNASTGSTTTIFPGVQLKSGLEYHAFAGADLHLLSILDFRIVELGAGGLSGSGKTLPLYSISSGLVLHLPSR